jgi:hypothetical protein
MNSHQPKTQDILPQSHFLNRLRVEKRRVDRSKTSLSLVLFYFQPKEEDGNSIQEFIASLQRNTRESDIKGWVSDEVVGLILPDTDERGANCFVEKMANGNGGLNYSIVSGIYPNDLFQKLLSEGKSTPDFFPLDLDGSMESPGFQLAVKRGMDILGALVGLILFSPIMLATAIAIKMASPGPIIFKQSRFGKNGIRFQFYNSGGPSEDQSRRRGKASLQDEI